MPFADDLLKDAYHLAQRGGQHPKQSSLRRAVSNAYYALFHLLISDFVLNWKTKGQRATLGRVFDHKKMKDTSKKISDKNVKNPSATQTVLRSVTSAFVRLQQARHDADYDNGKVWSRTDVARTLRIATDAFAGWKVIRKEPEAQDYLLSMLGPRQG
jgi:hypothetical protein